MSDDIRSYPVGRYVVTGDLTGLSMAIKAFNSTLNQGSFYGRHILGSRRRSFYLDKRLEKANDTYGNQKDLRNFMTSMFMPTDNFDALVPFRALYKCPGLNKNERLKCIEIIQNYIEEYSRSVSWSTGKRYNGNVGKLFRSFKREFYMAGLPIYAESDLRNYALNRIMLFSSNAACVYEDNYSLDYLNDIFSSKKCVYDYFNSNSYKQISELIKTSTKKTKIEHKKNTSVAKDIGSRLVASVWGVITLPIRLVPDSVRESKMYISAKKIYRKIKMKYEKSVNKKYAISASDDTSSDYYIESVKMSEYCGDSIEKEYFSNMDKAVRSKDILELYPDEERYITLSVYLKERISNRKQQITHKQEI